MDNINTESKPPSAAERVAVMIADSLEMHQKAMRFARMGSDTLEKAEEINDYNRTKIKSRSLSRVIHIQIELLRLARGLLSDTPDYDKLNELKKFVDNLEQRIIIADKTRSLSDDIAIEKIDNDGEKTMFLTQNYYEIRESLEESFEEIFMILSKNGLTSQLIKSQNKREKLHGI